MLSPRRGGCLKDLPPEDRIKARLRELTEDSRRLRHELEQLIRKDPDRGRSSVDDRPPPRRPPKRRS